MATERLDPSGDNTNSDWTGTFTDINDGSDATSTTTAASFTLDNYNIDLTSASSGLTINSVSVFVRAFSSVATDDLRVTMRRNFSFFIGLNQADIGTSVAEWSYEWLTDPSDSAAWTSAEIDEFNTGTGDDVGVQGGDMTGTEELTQMWVIVDYDAAGGNAPTAALAGPLVGPLGGPIG